MKLKRKRSDHDRSNKNFTTQQFNKLTAENFTARLAQVNLASTNDVVASVSRADFDDKLKL